MCGAPANSAGTTRSLRGVGLVIGAVLVAALFVWGSIGAAHWMWPAGQLLTLTKPTGGTIVGPGLSAARGLVLLEQPADRRSGGAHRRF